MWCSRHPAAHKSNGRVLVVLLLGQQHCNNLCEIESLQPLAENLTCVPSSNVMNCANAMGSSLPPASAAFFAVPDAAFSLGSVG